MSDLEALYRAVLAHPDEDTPRLMYADEVQESDPARAELIRVQCWWYTLTPAAQSVEELNGKRERERELLAANRERWEPACVACGGEGKFAQKLSSVKVGSVTIAQNVNASFRCNACNGTGRQPCRWERGFPVVTVAEMRQVWELGKCPKCSGAGEIKFYVPEGPSFDWGKAKPEVAFEVMRKVKYRKCGACSNGAVWQPTPWLCDLLRTHHVAGVVPGDKVPLNNRSGWFWVPRIGAAGVGTPANQLFGPLEKHAADNGRVRMHRTPELATAALGRAVVLAALEWLDAQGAT